MLHAYYLDMDMFFFLQEMDMFLFWYVFFPVRKQYNYHPYNGNHLIWWPTVSEGIINIFVSMLWDLKFKLCIKNKWQIVSSLELQNGQQASLEFWMIFDLLSLLFNYPIITFFFHFSIYFNTWLLFARNTLCLVLDGFKALHCVCIHVYV